MELGTSITTGLGPQPHAHPPRHLAPTATCELEQEKMRFMARARATGVRGRAKSGATGSRTRGTWLAAAVQESCQKQSGTRPARDPSRDPPPPHSIRGKNPESGLKTPPWPCPSPPRRRHKGCGLCDLAVFSNRAGPQLGMAQSQREPCSSGPASPHHALGPGLQPLSQPRLGQAPLTPSPR